MATLYAASDGTTRSASLSIDGVNWYPFHSSAHTDFITPDQVGFGGMSNDASHPASIRLLSWTVA